jgi:hypothetical protein
VERSSRRQFLARGALLAAAAAGAAAGGAALGARAGDGPAAVSPPPPSGPKRLRKLLDIGPGGVIHPGSAQDLRAAGNAGYFTDTRTPWIRLWADWPSLQPSPDHAPDDPLNPAAGKLRALDEQIALANQLGIRVLLMPYRFPRWANGTEDGLRGPRDQAPEYRLLPGAYAPEGAWARYFAFLHDRYHAGRETGPRVAGLELVNEPNLQLWPQPGVAREVAQLLQTAQAISARSGHSTMLFAPSISDDDARSSERHTRWDEFVPALLDELEAIGYRPHARQAWSQHNYTDVEKRQTQTRGQAIRALLKGRWDGFAEGEAPTVFITEGGARLSRMPHLYPDERPREAQARCLRDAWALHARADGAGAGVAMFAQYLLYADPNFDCGLLDPYPSTVKRPAYEAWKAFPGEHRPWGPGSPSGVRPEGETRA